MNKRQAKRIANRIASSLVDASLWSGSWAECSDFSTWWTKTEIRKIQEALKELAQKLFEKGDTND